MKYTVTAPDGRQVSGTAPDGTSQEEIMAYVQANMPPVQANMPPLEEPAGILGNYGMPDNLTQLMERSRVTNPQQDFDSVVGGLVPGGDPLTTLSNAPGSAYRLGAGIVKAAASPIQTATTIGQGVLGGYENAVEALSGVSGDPTQNQMVANAFAEHYARRYSSPEALKNTMETDPVGFLSDIAGMASAGGMTTLAKTADPINAALNIGRIGISKVMPKNMPANMMETALKLRPSLPVKVRENIVRTILDENIPPTIEGLHKAQRVINGLENTIQTITDAATQSGQKIPAAALYSNIARLRKELGGVTLTAGSDLAAAEKLIRQFTKTVRKSGSPFLTPTQVLRFKRNAYNAINWGTKKTKAKARNETFKAFAEAAKRELEKIDSSVKPTNRRMGDMLEMSREMERVVSRLQNRNILSLDTSAKIGAGTAVDAVHGLPGVGTVAGGAAAMLGNPRIKAEIALRLHAMQLNAATMEAISIGSMPKVVARQLLEKAQRAQEELASEMPNN